MRGILLAILICSGCASAADKQQLRHIESELTLLRTDMFYYRINNVAASESSVVLKRLEDQMDKHIDESIKTVHKLTGDED
jgi:hypothetical protein